MNMLKITQVRSIIKCQEVQKKTIKAMGLARPNHVVQLPDNPQTRGMIDVVKHLVKVEEISG